VDKTKSHFPFSCSKEGEAKMKMLPETLLLRLKMIRWSSTLLSFTLKNDSLKFNATVDVWIYYIPDARIWMFSPQLLYFIQEQVGELYMNRDGVTLQMANEGVRLSFPINKQNNLPLALLPILMESGLYAISVSKEVINLSATYETNQNMMALQK
jgi:hypothetical protein